MPLTFNLYAVVQALACTYLVLTCGRAGLRAYRHWRMLRREQQAQTRATARIAFLASQATSHGPQHRSLRPGYMREHQASVTPISARRIS